MTCRTSAQMLPGPSGTRHIVSCPAGCTSTAVWGTGTYSDDSMVCVAAIHAGVLTGEGGSVTVTIADGRDSYPASTQNGVTSRSWGSWGRSFALSGADCDPRGARDAGPADAGCLPQCGTEPSADECGDDGCGGTCGAGACLVEGTACLPTEAGRRCLPCTPSCDPAWQCGDDGCGGSCGACPGGAAYCDTTSHTCRECIPDCGANRCGRDPVCGLSCGECSSSSRCHRGGTGYFCLSLTCRDSCGGSFECGRGRTGDCSCGRCPSGEVCEETWTSGNCVRQGTCTADCSGRVCGDDGCGGSCGSCPAGQTCYSSGQCMGACTPSCTGRSCGDDGCGGSCGTCPSGESCSSGSCVADPSCTYYSSCISVTAEHRTSGCTGELWARFTNSCGRDVECSYCVADGSSLTGCQLRVVRASESDYHSSGDYWCGTSSRAVIRFICTAVGDAPSCRTF